MRPKVDERAKVDMMREQPVTVEGGVGGQAHHGLGDESLRLGTQFTAPLFDGGTLRCAASQ